MNPNLKLILWAAFIILVVVALGGCACMQPEPQVITHEVQIPVSVACLKDVPPQPQYEYKTAPVDQTDGDVLLSLSRDFVSALTYEAKLRASQAGCK